MFEVAHAVNAVDITISEVPTLNLRQVVFRFENGRGASVINGEHTHGTELAVIKFHGEGHNDFELDYSTPVTSDVVGWIPGAPALIALLAQIQALPPVVKELDA